MMKDLGHDVFHYGAEGSAPECTEHIDIISTEEQKTFFGDPSQSTKMFPIEWNASLAYWQQTNMRAGLEILKRRQRKDFVCLVGGNCQQRIDQLVGQDLTINCEPFVGYYGVFTKYRVFETYTHQACVYGMTAGVNGSPNGNYYDAVIPNYYDLEDFPYQAIKGDYLLFIGRLIGRKGLNTVLAIQRATGLPLRIAGQGVKTFHLGISITTDEGLVIPIGNGITYEGVVGVKERAELMGNARCVLVPTDYMEPFGGVAVEAQLCGTPVVTTDFAAFSETVKHGVSGYRCHTLDHWVWAVNNVHKLSPSVIRRCASHNYSAQRVMHMYDEYFHMLYDLWDDGWNTLHQSRSQLNWLNHEPMGWSHI
jgi:glycosyltransferase involved in cell wall biosynthesis